MEKGSIVLTLENIGMLKKARVDIGGLSVIAGENDEGKSTVGKALMALIKADNMGKKSQNTQIPQDNQSYHKKRKFNRLISLLFDDDISENGKILLQTKTQEIFVKIENNECIDFINNNKRNTFLDCTFVQSPFVWDLCEFFSSVKTLEVDGSFYSSEAFDFKYPYIFWDIYKKLNLQRQHKIPNMKKILESIKSVMRGQFIKKNDKFYFVHIDAKGNIREIRLKNVAIGIKSFGLMQMFLENSYVTPLGFFTFDEPENHLHPTWQVKFAEILARLVQNHVCIMVNTHSPYMLEALHKYGKKYAINANFYLADSGKVEQIDDDNSATLERIYQKLNHSFIDLDEILDEEE